MKPDGVATEPSEPVEAEGLGPIAGPDDNEGASQNGTAPTPPHPDEALNKQDAPSTVKEAPGKAEDPKGKSKAPIKGKTTASGPATTGPGTRPKTTQSRVANGVTKTAASTAAKKPATTSTAEKKPSTAAGGPAPSKKPAGSSTATSRAQPGVTAVGTGRTTTTTKVTKTGTAVSTATGVSRRPATAPASAATKPKTTAPAPKPTTAKPSTSATAKTSSAPKTNRTIGNTASRPATTSATGRTTTTTTTTTTSTTTTAASRTSRAASQQPVKPLVTTSLTRKDPGKTGTTAPAKKPVAAVTSRPAASKPSNSDAPKQAAVTKRPLPSVKAPQPKPDDKKSVPTRKVPPSPRNIPSRAASGKTAAASSSHKPTGSSTTVTGKLQPNKPTQSVLPIVVKDKPASKEPAEESVQLSEAAVAAVAVAAVATAAAIATEESGLEPDATAASESPLDVPPSSSLNAQEIKDVPVFMASDNNHYGHVSNPVELSGDIQNFEEQGSEKVNEEVSAAAGDILNFEEQGSEKVNEEVAAATGDIQNFEEQGSEKVNEEVATAAEPVAHEAVEQESWTASPFDNLAAAIVPSVGLEVAEKAELINSECYEDVEEEREGSQQVSLSEMSGTQPTEESQPGSAGLPGSIWRAGALLSELDSEDVSCSQQGASELSAPGVLEGTESMDDLGDASLKGAEGASVGSPDFEKVPDILTNEDDDEEDDDDRVCDMEVGSERADDSHRQHHDNDIDEDEDVEMASEGVTESGLESYGNADEDDLTEDYRLDNLNRIQPPGMDMSVPPAAQWSFADPWAQLPQPASTLLSSPSSEHWDANPETPTQVPAQATIDVSNSERGPTSPYPSNLFEPPPFSTQSPPTTAEEDACPKLGLTPPQGSESQFGTLSVPELASDSNRDTGKPEELKDFKGCLGTEIHSKEEKSESLNPVLPDIMQDLGIHLEQADEEEEPETLPADDVLGGPATAPASAPSSPSSATEDEVSDTEGEMQISDPQAELPVIEPTCEMAPVSHNLSTLDEHEEIGGETEGGGGSETPQSATSAASYGFDYMTSNSNAQSSAESCSKSPGIFSLENEEQLPDEAKDPSLLKELTLMPTPADTEKIEALKCQHGEFQSHAEQQSHSEHQYMLCGESTELPEPSSLLATAPVESTLIDPSSYRVPQHPEEPQDPDTQHPYYSTICGNSDSPLAGNV